MRLRDIAVRRSWFILGRFGIDRDRLLPVIVGQLHVALADEPQDEITALRRRGRRIALIGFRAHLLHLPGEIDRRLAGIGGRVDPGIQPAQQFGAVLRRREGVGNAARLMAP